jgi:hypothetical protein
VTYFKDAGWLLLTLLLMPLWLGLAGAGLIIIVLRHLYWWARGNTTRTARPRRRRRRWWAAYVRPRNRSPVDSPVGPVMTDPAPAPIVLPRRAAADPGFDS